MAVHELGSNAIKYGALSQEYGSVDITWSAVGDDASTLELSWIETGGPHVEPPNDTGFGSTILRILTPRATGGVATYDFLPNGVRWTLTAPLRVSAIELTAGTVPA
jgi:two-component sensor histidine kinase